MNYYVMVYLFTKMDEFDQVQPVRYNLDEEDIVNLSEAITNNQKLIPFGAVLHHVDDIIQLEYFKTDEKPYVEFNEVEDK